MLNVNYCRLSYGRIDKYLDDKCFGFIRQIYPEQPSKELIFIHSSKLADIISKDSFNELSNNLSSGHNINETYLWFTKEETIKGLAVEQCWFDIEGIPIDLVTELVKSLMMQVLNLKSNFQEKSKISQNKIKLTNFIDFYDLPEEYFESLKQTEQYEVLENHSNISYTPESVEILSDIYTNEDNGMPFDANEKISGVFKYKENEPKLTLIEKYEISEWIKLYFKLGRPAHYEVNNYITKFELWDNFQNIRSYNDHGIHKEIPGVRPKIFRAICLILGTRGNDGCRLIAYREY